MQAVWRNPALLGLLLISGLTARCWQTIYFYYQLYLYGPGFSLTLVGLVVAASTASNFLFMAPAPHVMRFLPERWLVPIFVAVQITGLLMMSLPQPVVGLVGYPVLLQAAIAILGPAVSTYINERSPEEQRATVLSFQTGRFSAAMILLFPLFGLDVLHASYSTVYLWTLEALTAGSLVTWGLVWIMRKIRRI